MQKILKIHRVDPEENASQTFRQADGQMNRTDFKGFLPQSWRFNHAFCKFKIRSGNNQYNERNTINIVQFSKSLKTMILSEIR